jgi:predicted nucleic acid-binding protein
MVVRGRSSGEFIFIDTSLIVAATVEVHPSHGEASACLDQAIDDGMDPGIRLQVCREFLVVLTRQPVSGRTFELAEALASLDVWTTGCRTLDENELVLRECLDLVRRFDVRGKQVHDCNIVATMRAHGVRRLATRNSGDFERYGALIDIDAVP